MIREIVLIFVICGELIYSMRGFEFFFIVNDLKLWLFLCIKSIE